MACTKVSSKGSTNFEHLLQDIRGCLGEDYVLYEECILAIARSAARKEDTSAWNEQLQQLVEGVVPLQISHAGVLFLIGNLSENPLSNTPSPPLPHRKSTSSMNNATVSPAATANIAEVGMKQTPTTALKNPEEDVVLFNDPAFRSEVEEFFAVKASANAITNLEGASKPSFRANASHHNIHDFMPPYKATDDDLQTFRERKETTLTTQGDVTSNDSDRAKRNREWQQITQQVNDSSADL